MVSPEETTCRTNIGPNLPGGTYKRSARGLPVIWYGPEGGISLGKSKGPICKKEATPGPPSSPIRTYEGAGTHTGTPKRTPKRVCECTRTRGYRTDSADQPQRSPGRHTHQGNTISPRPDQPQRTRGNVKHTLHVPYTNGPLMVMQAIENPREPKKVYTCLICDTFRGPYRAIERATETAPDWNVIAGDTPVRQLGAIRLANENTSPRPPKGVGQWTSQSGLVPCMSDALGVSYPARVRLNRQSFRVYVCKVGGAAVAIGTVKQGVFRLPCPHGSPRLVKGRNGALPYVPQRATAKPRYDTGKRRSSKARGSIP